MLKKKDCFFAIFFIIIALVSCKSTPATLDNFADVSVKVNVAVKVKLMLRTEDIVPDHFFVQNVQTYKVYEMSLDSKNCFYYLGLPVGTYRVGYWLARHETGSPTFKCCGFAETFVKIPYSRDSSNNISLGVLSAHYKVSNLNVKCVNASLHSAKLTLDHQGEFEAIDESNITNGNVEDSLIFKKFSAGTAEYYDDDYAKLSNYLYQMENYEAQMLDSYLRVINKEYRNRGIDGATNLVNGFLAIRYNELLNVKLAQLYYAESDSDKCQNIFDKMYEKNVNFAEYFGMQGLNAYKSGDYDNAVTLFYKAVSLGSRWGDVYDSFAKILIEQNNIPTASVLSDHAVQLDSNNATFLQTNLEIAKINNDNKKRAKLEKLLNRINGDKR